MLRLFFSELLHQLLNSLPLSKRRVSGMKRPNEEVIQDFSQTKHRWMTGKDLLLFPVQGCNLLPYRHLRAQRCRAWRFSEFALAACLGLLMAGLLSYQQSAQVNRAAQNEKIWQRQLDAWQPQLAEKQRLNTLLTTQQQRLAAQASLLPEQFALTTLLNQLAHLRQANISVTQLKMEAGTSTIHGVANDYAALSHWVQRLKQTGSFAHVDVTQVQQHASLPNARVTTSTPHDLTFSVNLSAAAATSTTPALSTLPSLSKKPMPAPLKIYQRGAHA